VKTLLIGQTSAGDSVFINRESRMWKSELPAIIIFATTEAAQPRALNSKQYLRTLDLLIKIKVSPSDSVDSELDDIAGSVEDLLSADQSLGGTVITSELQNTEITIESDGERDVGVAVLTFTAKYIA
jgi:hypothetical protein